MMTDNATTAAPLHVEVLSLPEAMPGTVFSAIDVLQLAALVLKLRNRHAAPALTWSVWLPHGSAAMLTPAALAQLSSEPPLLAPVPERTLLVVPAVYAANALELPALAQKYPDVLARIATHVQHGGALAVCATGLIFAAETGLLEQARLDAHWAFKSFFMRIVPQADFSASEAISVNSRLYSCVVPPSQSEMLIRVLHDCFDEEVAQSCARLLLFQPERQQMHSQQLTQQWLSRTADSPVYRAKQWLEMHVEQPYDLPQLAAVASASERTLLRHFQSVLGRTPLEFLHELRIQRAKVMLEISINSLQTIAHACGYANASTFSKLFRRSMGMSPGEYRKLHTLRTKRSHWRMEE
ncbi:GlxA family transcriptional regulator [Pseudoduganella danionis]|uniref:GlxA family transcriptional regulator n=1 Tax=Pseudoduganella danionis TaxID=1890295 RepID=UPI0035B39C7D